MNDEIRFAAKLRQNLNHGLRLQPGATRRLREARERALARHRAVWLAEYAAAADAGRIAGRGLLARFGGLGGLSLRLLVPLVVLAVGLTGIYRGQKTQRAADVEEIDTQLLTGDLPIDAYLDRDFEAWLQRKARRTQAEGE